MERRRSYAEQRRIGAEELRTICILHGWYSKGTCSQYDRLFQRACSIDNLTTEDIANIAEDIIEHSDEESLSGYEFEDVMYAVILKTYTTVKRI